MLVSGLCRIGQLSYAGDNDNGSSATRVATTPYLNTNGEVNSNGSMGLNMHLENEPKTVLLRARPLKLPVPDEYFNPKIFSISTKKRDTLTEGFTSLSTLKQLKTISGSWVTIISPGNNGGLRRRTIRLFSLNEECETNIKRKSNAKAASGLDWAEEFAAKLTSDASDNGEINDLMDESKPSDFGYIYVSPLLLFNLQAGEGDVLEVATLGKKQRAERLVEDTPPLARRVTIARVRCPGSSGYAEYGKALRNFFRVHRVLAIDDVIAVPMPMKMKLETSSDPNDPGETGGVAESVSINESTGSVHSEFCIDSIVPGQELPTPTTLVHFQVTDLHGSGEAELETMSSYEFDDSCLVGMLIDGTSGETMMAQAGAVNSRVPNPNNISTYLKMEHKLHEGEEYMFQLETNVENVFGLDDNQLFKDSSSLVKKEYLDQLNKLILPRVHKKYASMGVGAAVLVCGAKGTGKDMLVHAIAERFGLQLKEISLTPLRGLPEDRTAKRLRHIFAEVEQVSPCIVHLRHLHALAPVANGSEAPQDPDQVVNVLKTFIRKTTGMDALMNGSNKLSNNDASSTIIVIASTEAADETPAVFRACFTHQIDVKSPDKDQRLLILEYLTEKTRKQKHSSSGNRGTVNIAEEVSLESLATRTAGRTILELKSMLANAGCKMINRLMEVEEGKDEDNIIMALTSKDINDALDELPTTSADIGAPKIPNVYWKDVGGLGHAKDEIMDMIQLPLEHPELFASGVRQRSGLLLYGPPGTGKTLIAKAVATECSLNFISVKGPELLDMYIGESERKVRQVFETARSAKPCVLFFDELDSLAPQRGRGADSGGVMDRVVSQLLTEIDGMQGNSDVFVIGATNRPDLLDQSLLRPGRFDRLIYLGISKDRDAQLKIIKAITRKYKHTDCVDFDTLLDKIGGRLTGADFYALCSGAMANALKRKVEDIQHQIASHNKSISDEFLKLTPRKILGDMDEEELTPYVSMEDYHKALETTVPSVSEEELQHYEALREKFSSLGS